MYSHGIPWQASDGQVELRREVVVKVQVHLG